MHVFYVHCMSVMLCVHSTSVMFATTRRQNYLIVMLILHLWCSLHVCDIHTVFIDCMANTDCIFVLFTASMMLHVHVSDVTSKYLWYSFHSHDAHSTSVMFAACQCCSLHCQPCSLYSCGVHCLSLIFRSWARSDSFCQTQCSPGCRPLLWESNTTFKHLA